MPTPSLFRRSPDKPRLSIRERFRSTAAKILPRMSRKHTKGGGTDPGRRVLVAGSLASVAAIPFGAQAAPAADADLIALGREFLAVGSRINELEPQAAEIWDKFDSLAPSMSDALRVRSTDWLGVETYQKGKHRWYGPTAIESLRSTPRTKRKFNGTQEDWNNIPQGPLTEEQQAELAAFYVDVPDPKRQARADEVVAAWDAWQAERHRIARELGLQDVTKAVDDLYAHLNGLGDALLARTPSTLAGFIVQAQAAAWWRGGVEIDPDAPAPDRAAFAIIRNLLRMSGDVA